MLTPNLPIERQPSVRIDELLLETGVCIGDGIRSLTVLISSTSLVPGEFLCVRVEQRDRAAWLMGDSDPILDTVTENLLDRLQVSGLFHVVALGTCLPGCNLRSGPSRKREEIANHCVGG